MTQDFGHPSYLGHIKESTATIAEVLGQNNYNTYQVGKWHEGARAVRKGDWKLVANNYDILSDSWQQNRQWRLFNLQEDPSELEDVFEQNRELARELLEEYEDWADAAEVLSPEEFVQMKADYKKRMNEKPAEKYWGRTRCSRA